MIAAMRVQDGSLFIRAAGTEYTKDAAVLRADRTREGTEQKHRSAHEEELRTALGALADQLVIDYHADGTVSGCSWVAPEFRATFDTARQREGRAR